VSRPSVAETKDMALPTCKVVGHGGSYVGLQGFTYLTGLRSGAPCRALVAHSAADDQAGIVLLPELDRLV
jgi:uncharacterized RmlC-like cupin family protein